MLVFRNIHEGLYSNLKMTGLGMTQHFLCPMTLRPLYEDRYLICDTTETHCVKLPRKISSYIISSYHQKILLQLIDAANEYTYLNISHRLSPGIQWTNLTQKVLPANDIQRWIWGFRRILSCPVGLTRLFSNLQDSSDMRIWTHTHILT